MEFQSKITGIQDLDRAFASLPRTTQRRASLPAMRIGMSEIRKLAETNVKQVTSSEATGLLSRNIRVYTLRRYRGNLRVAVQVRRGLTTSKGVRVGLYAGVLEYGKKNQPPRSWIRKAIREGKSVAISSLTREMNRRMVDAVKEARN